MDRKLLNEMLTLPAELSVGGGSSGTGSTRQATGIFFNKSFKVSRMKVFYFLSESSECIGSRQASPPRPIIHTA